MKKKNRIYERIFAAIDKPEYFFLVVASLFGIFFIFIIPPFQTPDEHVHFYRAYDTSQLGSNRIEKNGAIGSMLPSSIAKTEQALNAQQDIPTHIQFNPYNKYHLGFTKQALFNIPLDKGDVSFYRTETYPALVYIPQAVAVFVAKIFNSPIIVMLYFVRIVNLIIWVTVAFWCIKRFPWKRWALAGVCLLPVLVAQTISPGLDVLAIASTLVFITIILNGVKNPNEKFDIKKLLLLLSMAILMVLTKFTLAVFFLLVFLIKNKQMTMKHGTITKLLIVLIPVALFIGWTILSHTSGTSGPVSSSSQQISALLHNPLKFLQLLINTGFYVTVSGNALVHSIVGNFGWLDTPLSPFITFMGAIYIGFLLFVGSSKEKIVKIPSKAKVIMFLTVVGSVIATFLAMYVYSTLTTDNHIKGVQGRYLVPAMFLLLPLLLNNHITTSEAFYAKVVRWSAVTLLLVSTLTIIVRYYFIFIPT